MLDRLLLMLKVRAKLSSDISKLEKLMSRGETRALSGRYVEVYLCACTVKMCSDVDLDLMRCSACANQSEARLYLEVLGQLTFAPIAKYVGQTMWLDRLERDACRLKPYLRTGLPGVGAVDDGLLSSCKRRYILPVIRIELHPIQV